MNLNIDSFNLQWIGQSFLVPQETRLVFSDILKRLDTGLITFLIGPRRVGKSTLLKQSLNHIINEQKVKPTQTFFYEFEPGQTRQDLDLVINTYFENKLDKNSIFYMFLDEIQFIPNYELSLKYLVDQFPQARILITGSLSLGYKRKMAESLAGRILPIQIYPLCFEEYLKIAKLPQLKIFQESKNQLNLLSQAAVELNPEFQKFLTKATYPQAIFWPDTVPLKDFLDTIVNQSLNQDSMQFFNLERPDLISGLYKYLASNNGSEISLSTLASKTQSNGITIKKYLDVLEMLGLIYVLKNTLDPLKNINSKAKIYVNSMFENSWANTNHNNLGNSVESYVLERLMFSKSQISFFRDRNKEIDFINYTNKEVIEVKYKANIELDKFDFLAAKSKEIGYKPVIISQSQTRLNGFEYNNFTIIPACFI